MILFDGLHQHKLSIERGTMRAFGTPHIQILLWRAADHVYHVRARHAQRGDISWSAFRNLEDALMEFNFLAGEWDMTNKFTSEDKKFLVACGIATDPEPAPTPSEWDGTCDWIQQAGLPVTAENWMNLQFAGHPPAIGEVDGEVLAELPRFVRVVYDPDFDPDDERIPYGAESRWGSDEPCPEFCTECGTDFGMLHQAGCDVEEKD